MGHGRNCNSNDCVDVDGFGKGGGLWSLESFWNVGGRWIGNVVCVSVNVYVSVCVRVVKLLVRLCVCV